ncbi:hypothetical protein HWV62_23014 [Athelia sp. TMB]|nr:hypothetical protein HWV62_23014 [Athelia sp. TMB]
MLPYNSELQFAIPIELLQNILQELPQCQLFSICSLSRAFHKEVLRALYRHVNLVGTGTIDQVLSFAGHMIRRPDLAQLILAISLPAEIGCEYIEVDEALVDHMTEQLSCALKHMGNLSAVYIDDIYNPRIKAIYGYLSGDYFLGHAFRLQKFRFSSRISMGNLVTLRFLSEQSQIQDLETSTNFDVVIMDRQDNPTVDILPLISVASIWYDERVLFNLIASRPLRRLKLSMPGPRHNTHNNDLDAIHALAPASATLTHLYYNQLCLLGGVDEAAHVVTLEVIAQGLPNLKFLRYADIIDLHVSICTLYGYTFVSHDPVRKWDLKPWKWNAFPRALSAFKHLETFAIEVRDRYSVPARPFDLARGLVERCMASCSTLRYIAITGKPQMCDMHSNAIQEHISFKRVPGRGSKTEICSREALEESAWRDT